MSRTIPRRLLGQSPLTLLSKDSQSLRPFSSTPQRSADDPPSNFKPIYTSSAAAAAPPKPTTSAFAPRPFAPKPSALAPRSPSLNPKAATGVSSITSLFDSFTLENGRQPNARANRTILDTSRPSDGSLADGTLLGEVKTFKEISWQLHVNAHRHNVHITVARPPKWQHPETGVIYGAGGERTVALSMSAGNLGFRHSGRKHYDSAFQLASYVFGRMQESGMSGWIQELEVSLRGFGQGREAVSKALMGLEGKALRGKVIKVSDATRLKFGGTRSPKPRRLG